MSASNMTGQKDTLMVLKVNLECSCCYKKVKKLLCSIPEIRDQSFNVKQHEVRITVVCCSPERIKQKLCCKGGKYITDIKIIEKPPTTTTPTPTPPPTGCCRHLGPCCYYWCGYRYGCCLYVFPPPPGGWDYYCCGSCPPGGCRPSCFNGRCSN